MLRPNRNGTNYENSSTNKSVNKGNERIQSFFHDFPIVDDFEMEEEEESLEDSGEVQTDAAAVNDGLTEKLSKRTDEKRKRHRSRSKSKDKKEKRRRSRSRSKSRNRVSEDNPEVQKLVKKMVAEQVKQEMEKREKLANTSGMQIDVNSLRKTRSEATLYRPAVEREVNDLNGSPSNLIDLDERHESSFKHDKNFRHKHDESPGREFYDAYTPKCSTGYRQSSQKVNSEDINNTLSQLRLFADNRRSEANQQEAQQRGQIQEAREVADQAIIEAERFKARVQQPNRGEIQFNNTKNVLINSPKCAFGEKQAMKYLENEDDEFFHTTCHIEDTIREKIEKGKFVELDKLIQKRILQYNFKDQEHSRMQLINKDGMSYFVPTIDRESRIDGIKKWEQAFRVYTTIYCKANPNRAGEILQYIDTIHRAAAIFNWDNVAKYDYVFRQLMAAKPHRSWAKVYTQMWNLTLNEPIKKFNENGNSSSSTNQKGGSRKKDTYCWKYNKNSCTYGRSCRFEHKCSYCGVMGHPVTSCHKKHGKKGGGDKSDKSNSK